MHRSGSVGVRDEAGEHGRTVRQDRAGHGSSHIVELVPRIADPPIAGADADIRANILIVDDRKENLAALEAVIAPLGQNIVKASSGEEALKHLLLDEFALILLDAQMPGMDGFETAELIRSRPKTSHVPIIFITAFSKEDEQVFQGYAVGAVDYITKPFDPAILCSKVRVFVELYRRGEQLKRQAELLHQIELREAKRVEREMAIEREQEQIRALNAMLEARVAERTAQLLEANEEMEAFCYSVSHDLRAPLRAIMSTSMMLLEDLGHLLDDDSRKCLLRQSAAAKRLGVLIDDLLNLSRLGRRTMMKTELDLSRMAQQVADELRSSGDFGGCEIQIQPEMHAFADPGLTRILLQNLLENAFKYSPSGGKVEVGSQFMDGRTTYYVRDHGIGFNMEYRHRLFLPFERLVRDDEYEGTGIGLANVKRIVQRHGGRVWAESVPGSGSTFFFTL